MRYTVLSLILGASTVVKVTILILLLFSIISWSIIFFKFIYFRKAKRENDIFFRSYLKNRNPSELFNLSKKFFLSPLANVFRSVYGEMADVHEIERSIRRYEALEIAKLERYLNFLATTGSTTPFIGLFGTVWGIMNAFRGIGEQGSASLAVVAPGIAEALITTALGLFAAIPAVVAYNYYLSMSKRLIIEMEDFSEEIINMLVRHPGLEEHYVRDTKK